MSDQLITIIGTLGGAIIGSGITVVGIILNNHYLAKHEKIKRKRKLLDELCGLCFQLQKFFVTAIEGVYPISEFSFEPMHDIQTRMMAIIIMDFEEEMTDAMNEYFGYTRKLESGIEEFHALYVVNPSLDDLLIKSKLEQNANTYNDLLRNAVIFLKKIKKVSPKS